MNIAFIACVEQGNLENQVLLLCRSIRKYAGRYRNAPIYCFQPRKGPPLSHATLTQFRNLHVEYNADILNKDYAYYPIANKIVSCARAEATLSEDILVFVDSDTLFVNEPKELLLPDDINAAVRPVNKKRKGSTGTGDRNEGYWQKLYAMCGVSAAPFVFTTIGSQKIRAYWNAGLIVVRRSQGIFHAWQKDFQTLMAAKHYPSDSRGITINNMDQLALAATLAKIAERVCTLDYRYNYPLPLRTSLPQVSRTAQLEDLVHIHYFRYFNIPGFLESLQPSLNQQSEIYQWLKQFLPFSPIMTTSTLRKPRYVPK
ncbi:hypothetical protein GF339_12730 [candidate division KSB3 bacterium]|uniref:Nucleotide-diphospho-sugar transferase domain-containing protein n=1 Tax=candidate division KSB3 bacterium TaxID=2044937 RepID=A0A9D5JWC5_9BACT|nr:hypothetical protein [candidate division KSB3 bacterium]MBD3325448.1 hypothetical protein [candidate division KSB3 bacterium]